MSNTVRYVLYARKSSESEDRQVQSIDDQLNSLRECAKRLSLNIVCELTEAKSAKDPGARPLFFELLAKIERGEADGILSWNISRLSRNPIDSAQITWMLQRGVLKSVRTIDREYLPEDNVLLMAVETGFANQYILDLRKSVIRGMISKAEKGWFPGKAPPGYLNNKETREIDVDESKFDLVRRGWDLLLSGAYNISQVHERLTSSGVIGIARSNAYKLFSNPFYYGTFKYGGDLYTGKHKSMVRKDEFDQVQKILGKPGRIQPQKHEFAFTGLIRCGKCGCLVTASRKIKYYKTTRNTGVYIYYHCTGSKGCSKKSVREEYIEEQISSELRRCTLDAEFVSLLEIEIRKHEADRPGSEESLNSARSKRLGELTLKKEQLLELRMSGELDAVEYSSFKAKLHSKEMELLAAHASDRSRHTRNRETLEECVRFATTAYFDFCNGQEKTRRAVSVALSEEYVLTDGELKIRPRPLLAKLAIFEPLSSSPDKARRESSLTKKSLLCAWLDDIRTFVAENDIQFHYDPRKDDDVKVA